MLEVAGHHVGLENVRDEERPRAGVDRIADESAVRQTAVLVSGRRMFSDLSDADRDDLVGTAVDAYAFVWGPPGRPDDLEAWLALGMYHAMMSTFRERRMLRRPVWSKDATTLAGLLEEWLSADGSTSVSVDEELTDRFLRQLSPADARLLWLRCEGYTREEIADLLGIRANAVSVRLRRLRIRLRETLEPVAEPTGDGASESRGTGHGAA